MLKISNEKSSFLSLSLSIVFFVSCIVCAFFIPQYTDIFIKMKNAITEQNVIDGSGKAVIMTVAYFILTVMMAADVFLFLLLTRVRKGLVFTLISVSLIRAVSWCCILLGVLLAVLGFYFGIAFVFAFFAMFLALSLRVVKNVIEQAVTIKNENDLTV